MAQPKKKQWSWPTPKTVRTSAQEAAKGSTRYRVTKPDGTQEYFYNQADADAFINRMLAQYPNYKAVPLEEGEPSTPPERQSASAKPKQQPTQQQSTPQQPAAQAAAQQGTPQQGTVVQPSQPAPSSNTNSGSSSGGGGFHNVPEWARSFNRWINENMPWLNRGIDAFGNFVNNEILLNKNNIRVRNAQNNPEVMNAIQEGGNLAGGIIAAPFLAYGAAEAAPFLWNGLGWGINTFGRAMVPSQWASGLASYSRFAPYAGKLATAGK